MARSRFWQRPDYPGLRSVNDLLLWTKPRGNAPVLAAKREGAWATISARSLYDQCRSLVGVWQRAGLGLGDRVALLMESRPEWVVADLACLAAGLVDVPIYPTLTAEQTAYILRDSEARMVILSGPEQVEKVLSQLHQLPHLKWVMSPNGSPVPTDALTNLDWRAATSAVAQAPEENAFDEALAATPAQRLATLLYTSGTTGVPKGVPLTHANLVTNLNVTIVEFDIDGEERRLSILPLSHITERHLGYVDFLIDSTTYFAESIDKTADNLREVHPTLLVSVPRVFEKVAARTRAEVAAKPAPLQALFRWAQHVGTQMGPYWLAGWPVFGPRKRARAGQAPGAPHPVPPLSLRLRAALADRLVYRKLRQKLGGALNKILAGGAPLGRELAEFMLSLGVVIDEGYGLTETSPVIAVNRPGRRRLGSVGQPVPNVELAFASDGEILVRGDSVFSGYYHLPEETAAALTDGWFHTGDIGYQDEDGFLFITDRKRDLIKTSGGKFVAPQPIEAKLKAHAWVAEAVLVGDRRKYVSALLVPNFAAVEEYARQHGLSGVSHEQLCAHPEILDGFQRVVEATNRDLARFETIKRFALVPTEFSIVGGEITPTLKVRRRSVEEKYRGLIDSMYEHDGASTPA